MPKVTNSTMTPQPSPKRIELLNLATTTSESKKGPPPSPIPTKWLGDGVKASCSNFEAYKEALQKCGHDAKAVIIKFNEIRQQAAETYEFRIEATPDGKELQFKIKDELIYTIPLDDKLELAIYILQFQRLIKKGILSGDVTEYSIELAFKEATRISIHWLKTKVSATQVYQLLYRTAQVMHMFHGLYKKALDEPDKLGPKIAQGSAATVYVDEDDASFVVKLGLVTKDEAKLLRKYYENLEFAKFIPNYGGSGTAAIRMKYIPGTVLGKLKSLPEDALERFNNMIKAAEERGCYHADLHAGNVLYDEKTGKFYFIDLEWYAVGEDKKPSNKVDMRQYTNDLSTMRTLIERLMAVPAKS